MALSKSKYIKGLQCPKMLWLEKNKPDEADKLNNESIFATGNEVGDLAMEYFGRDFVEVKFCKDNLQAMVDETKDLMDKGTEIITEATFSYGGDFCSVDILKKNGDGVDIIEVKSSSQAHNVHIDDMAYQYRVLKKCGVNVKEIYLMHINNKYVRHGELNLKELFVLEKFTEEVKDMYENVGDNIEYINKVVSQDDEPDIDISENCSNPYQCAFWGYCTKMLPKPNVFDLRDCYASVKFNMYNDGIYSFSSALKPECILKYKLKDKNVEQMDVEVNNKPARIEKQNIKAFLNTLSYPVYYLDFETFAPAIPCFDEQSPYEQTPFQYSLHVKKSQNAPHEHYEFLAKEGTDPRESLAKQLVSDIPADVCVLAYNMRFEKGVIKKLAKMFPQYSTHLMSIHDNIKDLMLPFLHRDYYCKEMQGSYSIKYVLPALFPNDPALDYHNLNGVHNGSEASFCFEDMVNHTPEEIEEMRKSLLKYCELDTFAMVKIHEMLEAAAV